MVTYVVGLDEEAATQLPLVGGKGAGLAALVRTPGVRVPAAFCVTTDAYRSVLAAAGVDPQLDRLAGLVAGDAGAIAQASAAIRTAVEATPIPAEAVEQIDRHLAALGEQTAVAVRSSATAEDLPTASFAGQQESYLNVRGRDAVLQAISRCWASLFTERAVTYRLRNGFDHRAVGLAVVVQAMVFPDAAGVLFTADPLTSNRSACSIDAGFGLGEAIVSGLVDADHYLVVNGRISERRVVPKRTVVRPLAGGGTEATAVDPGRQTRPALTDEQVLRLAGLGRRIEARMGRPQDIEWCLVDGDVFVVQSRPITTLFPLPDLPAGTSRVYMSFGHQQMMTDAMTPLGLSFFIAQFEEEALPTVELGGRIFLDLSHDLASPVGRLTLRLVMGSIDPIMLHAVKVLVRRRAFMRSLPRGPRYFSMGSGYFTWRLPLEAIRAYRRNDPDRVPTFMAQREATLAAARATLEGLSGEAVFDFIGQDFRQLKQDIQDPQGMGTVYAGMVAQALVNRTARRTLRDPEAGSVLARAVTHDVTAEMGVALLDVADVVREHPAAMDGLAHLGDADFFDGLARLEGGPEVAAAIRAFLDRYGMRCAGEIDITRPRWNEQPTALVPMILIAASPGTVEGRARVILSVEQADLAPGDILVTTFTDPSWTPAFLSITGLVTEVGGQATHGSVIAREYGLPAVVGVENVTRLVTDGQRIRVNGTDGYVEVL